MKRSTLKKVSLLLLLAGSFIVDLLIQSPPSLYYLQIQRSIWLFLPETERSRFPGKYHRYAAVQHEYPYLPEYRYQGQGSSLPAECWRNAGYQKCSYFPVKSVERLTQCCISGKVQGTGTVIQNQDFRFFYQARAMVSLCFWPPERFYRSVPA